MSQLLWEASPWWVVLCLVVGLAYAWLLYGKAHRLFSKPVRYGLFALRWVVVSLLAILLLEPFIRQLTRRVEEPAFVIALDNSQSMTASGTAADSLERVVETLKTSLTASGQVEIITLTPPDSLTFSSLSSDLGGLLTQVRSSYENRNLAGMVLVSDGLYNQGVSPEYVPLPFPVYSLGAGDTTARRDVVLKNLYYNKISYQGNKYSIEAEIVQQGYQTGQLTLQVLSKGAIIQQKQLSFTNGTAVLNEEVILEATTPGYQNIEFRVLGPADEYTTENNSRSAYIEVIEGRQKILIAAASPHPDIAALRQAIERNQNYQTEVVITALNQQAQEERYDAIILHGLPATRQPQSVAPLLNLSSAHFFIWTPQTDISQLNSVQNVLTVNQQARQTDQVFPVLNTSFTNFSLPAQAAEALAKYPPAQVPYGNTNLRSPAQALLLQRIGRISTDKPLLALSTNQEPRQAVLLAEGSWRWRLREAAEEPGQAYAPVLDDLLQKTIQLLATPRQEQKFRVYPLENEVLLSEGVTFETELYNQLFERIYGQTINLTITNENGGTREFTYVNTEGNSRYAVQELPAGVYTYQAATKLNAQTLSSRGSFRVIDQQLEMLNLTANHALLQKIAEKTGGQFFNLQNYSALADTLSQLEAKQAILTSEEYKSVLDLKWLLALLLLLISLEWFTRKYNGGY